MHQGGGWKTQRRKDDARAKETAADPKDARGEEPRYRGGEGTHLEARGATLGDGRYEGVSLRG